MADALAQKNAEDKGAPARGHVNHGSAGEIDRGDLGIGVPDAVHEACGTPDHVGERKVDHKHPEADEGHQGGELEALGRGPEDQGRRDDREGQLEDAEDVLRDPVCVAGVGC